MRSPLLQIVIAVALLACNGCKMAERSAAVESALPTGGQAKETQAGTLAQLPAQAGPSNPSGAPATLAGNTPQLAELNRKLVKTVDLQLRVRDTVAASDRLRELGGALGGYVSSLAAERREGLLYYTLTLRVPVERLEEAVRRAKGLAESVERESVRTEDVTQRWVDLDARLTTLRATEGELRQLLTEARQRRQDVDDIMAVYQKLTEIRSNIEQLQAEQQSLRSLTALSTVNLELVPSEAAKPIVAAGWDPGGTLRGSFRSLVGALQWLADVAIVVIVVVAPLLALVVLPLWLLARVWRRLRRRRAVAAET